MTCSKGSEVQSLRLRKIVTVSVSVILSVCCKAVRRYITNLIRLSFLLLMGRLTKGVCGDTRWSSRATKDAPVQRQI